MERKAELNGKTVTAKAPVVFKSMNAVSGRTACASWVNDPDLRSLQQRQLVGILHAACCDEENCPMEDCAVNRRNFLHVSLCFKPESECPVKHCSRTKRLLAHWTQCGSQRCTICAPACKMCQPAEGQENEESQPRKGRFYEQRPADEIDFFFDNLPMPIEVEPSKDWQRAVSISLRSHNIGRLLIRLEPNADPSDLRHFSSIVNFSRVVEKRIFTEADGRDEYYAILASNLRCMQTGPSTSKSHCAHH